MPEPLALDRRSTAVLVVDMQNAFLDEQGSLARLETEAASLAVMAAMFAEVVGFDEVVAALA